MTYYYWNGGWQSLLAGPQEYLTYWDEVLADSPLALWKLDEASGTDMLDSSGNGRDGTYTTPPVLAQTSIIPSVDDTCADFVPNDYATVSDSAWMDVGEITVEAVVEADTTSGNLGFVSRYPFPTAAAGNWALGRFADKWAFWCRDAIDTYRDAVSGSALSTGTAYHIIGTYESGTALRLFVNGTEVDADESVSGSLPAQNEPIEVGKYFGSNFFDGKIQGVAIYSGVLSDARILAHAQAAGLA